MGFVTIQFGFFNFPTKKYDQKLECELHEKLGANVLRVDKYYFLLSHLLLAETTLLVQPKDQPGQRTTNPIAAQGASTFTLSQSFRLPVSVQG